MNADGSHPVNLTHTPDVDELYPKPSPDGPRSASSCDEGKGDAKSPQHLLHEQRRHRPHKVADNGREPCWSPDGTRIAYMRGEFEKFTYLRRRHQGAVHLRPQDRQDAGARQQEADTTSTPLNWSPDGKWFVATVHGGMGFSHPSWPSRPTGTRSSI